MGWTMDGLVLAVAVVTAGVLAFTPALRRSSAWAATATPLASIMGSGFLVSAPLLVEAVGVYAPLAMAGLLGVAYGVGSIVRFNIRVAEPVVASDDRDGRHRSERGHQTASEAHWALGEKSAATHVEQASHLVLAAAYLVSVTYYLGLLSAFTLDGLGLRTPLAEKAVTTALMLAITALGAWRGLRALEGLERYAIALNLGLVAALLVGLAVLHVRALVAGDWALPSLAPSQTPLAATRHLMGLLIIVQGFETSRFLGSEHSPAERARTMRVAQLVSAAIYVVFCTLALALFESGVPSSPDVTAIVHLVAPVATVLPAMIVVAAVGSQFSAAVADDAGAAGLTTTIFAGRLSRRTPYLLLGAGTIALTWAADVMEILSYASRAFAVFYALQCVIATLVAAVKKDAPGRRRVLLLAPPLALLCAAVAVFGIPAES